MQSSLESQRQDAVLVFVNDKIDRELQAPEFEAIMDGFVPIPDFARQSVRCVFVSINPRFRVTSAVFFLIRFDERGIVDRHWNVPLEELAQKAARGPDLGAGPIGLACFSQCPDKNHQRQLWDPVMEPGRNSFALMKKAVAANRLGLIFPEPEEPEPPKQPAPEDTSRLKADLQRQYARSMRNRLAQTLKEQRLRIHTLKSRMALKIEALKREHQDRLSGYQRQIDAERDVSRELRGQVQALEDKVQLLADKNAGVREYYEHKFASARQDESDQLKVIEERLAREMDEQVEQVRTELQQRLDMREMELYYRQQQESALRDELESARAEREQLLQHGAEQVLMPLTKAGIEFVTTQPGAGKMQLSADDVPAFMADPAAFVAEHCGVSEQTYRLWLDHYHSPYCNATGDEGEECGRGVKRVTDPREFRDGESNRCDEHQSFVQPAAASRG